ncbi:MAG TPA: PEP-CTERM sorting domain-containing protein [Phycisphaerae bacterium]|nr:PEP-CTERM sorting domain-containing protein [Phycisphaerae bacterium]
MKWNWLAAGWVGATCAAAFGHAGPRIYLDIENGKVMTYEGPYPAPTDFSAYGDYAPSRVFPGAPPDETTTNGEPDTGILPLHWDDDPSNFSTEFPGLQAYPPGQVAPGTSFSYKIAGEVQWYDAANERFIPISQALTSNTPFMAVTNDIGDSTFSSSMYPESTDTLAFTYNGDPTDHQHLTFTILTPDDYPVNPNVTPHAEDAPAGIYALPLIFTSGSNQPSDTVYLLFGDRGPNLSISQSLMETEMQTAIGVANATLVPEPATLALLGAACPILLRRRR